MTVNHDVAGSNPASGASGLFVKRLRHRPFTAGSGVRIPHRSPWAISSAGRASALQAECQQFDPVIAHQKKASRDPLRGAFFLPFFFFLYGHVTSCIRTHDHLRVALLLQMMFAAEPVRSCYRPPERRPHVICSMGSFFLPFSFFLYGHVTSCIRTHDHLRVALLLQMMFAAEPVRSCHRPPKKSSRDLLRGIFCCHFPFPSFAISPALKKSIASHPPKGYNT